MSTILAGKSLALMLTGTAVAVGGGSYLIKNEQGDPIIQSLFSTPEIKQDKKAEEELASLSKVEEPIVEEPSKPLLPTFDILRVEKDGSVLIAGKVPSEGDVEIIENGQVIAKGRSESNGDFVIVLDQPLSAGDHELYIQAKPDDGEIVVSKEAGIISIPSGEGEVLAMVSEPGEATRILQKPEVESTPEPEIVAEVKVATLTPVSVQAVDVETGAVFIAGTGNPGSRASIYLDGVYEGSVVIAQNGSFLFEMDQGLQAGIHDLRVDMQGSDGGEVLSRASIVIEHELEQLLTAKAEVVDEKKPTIQTGRSVIIRRGDSLWKVSRRMLGEGKKYTLIFSANDDQISDPHLIFPGQVFNVPDTASTSSDVENSG